MDIPRTPSWNAPMILAHKESAVTIVSSSTDGVDDSLTSKSVPDAAVVGEESITDLGGEPITSIASSCDFISALSGKGIDHVRICWLDMTSTLRARLVPTHRALFLLQQSHTRQGPLETGLKVSVATAALSILQNDHLINVAGASPVGEWDLCADLTSLRLGPRNRHAMLMGNFREKSGEPVPSCPRTLLEDTMRRASQHGLSVLLGFEIEFVLLERKGPRQYDRLSSDAHAWCSFGATDTQDPAGAVIEEAVASLARAGVLVELVHAESAFGQFEIVLPPKPALAAVDTLIYVRAILATTATAHGYKTTLHPKPFPDTAGTAAHAHMSLRGVDGEQVDDAQIYEPFYAGILSRLRGVMAFTCASPCSYERVVDGCWAGGTWVTWGYHNRETPLRKVDGSHWEIRCVDGLANPYLAMSAIIASGLRGIVSKTPMAWKECTVDPAVLSEAERSRLNIRERLPTTLEEALCALEKDGEMANSMLGEAMVERYVAIKRAEIGMLQSMKPDEQRQWIIERY
ncbi:Protein fluG [Emericellopsis cladophorae]|uniref:Glutamine synthetase n=1 Tax=Emericellopsis cladophorae TaxID=2686198 RepID=A0A9Q0BFB5_9HYPO|nr:Protein fluG [Emericellopsis cladophorae]KAI6782510.1 Protein fluG [Emericellopsis cladophorae]